MGCCGSCDSGGPCDCGDPNCQGGCRESVSGDMIFDQDGIGSMLNKRHTISGEWDVGAAKYTGSKYYPNPPGYHPDDPRSGPYGLFNYPGGACAGQNIGADNITDTNSRSMFNHPFNWAVIPDVFDRGNAMRIGIKGDGTVAVTRELAQAFFPYLFPGESVSSMVDGQDLYTPRSGKGWDNYGGNNVVTDLHGCSGLKGDDAGTCDFGQTLTHYIEYIPGGSNYVDENGFQLLFASVRSLLPILEPARQPSSVWTTYLGGQALDYSTKGADRGKGHILAPYSIQNTTLLCSDGTYYGYAGPPTDAGQDIPGYGPQPNPNYDPSQPPSPTNPPYIDPSTGLGTTTPPAGYPPTYPPYTDPYAQGYPPTYPPYTDPYAGMYPPSYPPSYAPPYPPQYDPGYMYGPPADYMPMPQFIPAPMQQGGFMPQGFPGGGFPGGGFQLPDPSQILQQIGPMIPQGINQMLPMPVQNLINPPVTLYQDDYGNIYDETGMQLDPMSIDPSMQVVVIPIGQMSVSGYDVGAANPYALSLMHKGATATKTPTTTKGKSGYGGKAGLKKAANSAVAWKRFNRSGIQAQVARFAKGATSRSKAPAYGSAVSNATAKALKTGGLSPNAKANLGALNAKVGNLQTAKALTSNLKTSLAANAMIHQNVNPSTAIKVAPGTTSALNARLSPLGVQTMARTKQTSVSGDFDNSGDPSTYQGGGAYGYQTPIPDAFAIMPDVPEGDELSPEETYDPYSTPGSVFPFGTANPSFTQDDGLAYGFMPVDYAPEGFDQWAGYPPYDELQLEAMANDPYAQGSDPYGASPPPMDPGYPPPANYPTDPSIDPSTGLPWGYDPNAQQTQQGATIPANLDPNQYVRPGALTLPNASQFFSFQPKPTPRSAEDIARLHTTATPQLTMPPSKQNVAAPRLTVPAAKPSMATRAATFRMHGESVGGNDLLDTLTKLISGKQSEGDKGGPATDGINKMLATKDGDDNKLIKDIASNVIKYAPMALMLIAGDAYDYNNASATHLYELSKKGDKAAIQELFSRVWAGEDSATFYARKLLGLPETAEIMPQVSGMDWSMQMDLRDEFSNENIGEGGYEMSPYDEPGPWGMGEEISPYGEAGPWNVGAGIDPALIDDAINHSLETVERLMARAELGDPTARDAIKALYQAAKNGNKEAYAVCMLTANTPGMPYQGTTEKRVTPGR